MKRFNNLFEHSLAWLVLGLLLLYTYAKFFEHPYAGYRVSSNGSVLYVFVKQTVQPALQVNDQVIRMGALRWADFKTDNRKRIFENARPGDVIPLTIVRNGQTLTIPWTFPGPNRAEINDLLISEGWLGYVFWFCGTITLLSLRPKDERWRLMIAFNYLTAIWLTVGSGISQYHIWGGAMLLRTSIWLCLPVYLHLHWLFPRKLTEIPAFITVGIYFISAILAGMEWFQLLPVNLYFTGFLLAVLGSLFLLIAHFIFQADSRTDLRLLLIVALLALLPAVAVAIVEAFIGIPILTGAGMLGLPILPVAYLYAVNRRQLGGLEIRINRFISIYLFLFLVTALMIPVVALASMQVEPSGGLIAAALASGALATMVGIVWFPAFQAAVEQRLLGIKLPASNMIENFSARIVTSITLSDLLKLLEQEVFPSLLVRQYAFVRILDSSVKIILSNNVDQDQVSREAALELLAPDSTDIPPLSNKLDQSLGWIRLRLPLQIGPDLIGVWLLGRRDPDDLYPQAELPILQSLANQTAIALSNILHTEQIRDMYEVNILRHEQERLRLARDLHDSVLNELAALTITADAPVLLSPKNQAMYETVTQRLREIVSDLRPPMLNFGLKPAIDGLAENLMERVPGSGKIIADLQADGECRYPEMVEINLFRIAQEASQNALRYAHANSIHLTGTLTPHTIDLRIVDDGIGFATDTGLQLNEMLAKKHFGLANMFERANLIGAAIKIDSRLGQGTTVRVKWASKPSH